jgi:hypothetical protein
MIAQGVLWDGGAGRGFVGWIPQDRRSPTPRRSHTRYALTTPFRVDDAALSPASSRTRATLGAIAIDAMIGLIARAQRYYRVNRSDWVFFMGAMIDPGTIIGI